MFSSKQSISFLDRRIYSIGVRMRNLGEIEIIIYGPKLELTYYVIPALAAGAVHSTTAYSQVYKVDAAEANRL